MTTPPFDHILWLSGMPRSGTNWISQILASSPQVRMKFCPLFSHEFKDECNQDSSPEVWQDFFSRVYQTTGSYLDQDYLRKDGLVPEFIERLEQPPVLAIKSTRYHHLIPGLLEKLPNIRFIVLIRHPAASIYSWLDNPMEFPAHADPLEQWRSGQVRKTGPGEFWGFNDWLFTTRQTLALRERWGERVLIYRYESFVQDAIATTRDLFQHLDIELTHQTLEFLSKSQTQHSEHKRAVFKRPEDSERWRKQLDPHIREAIETELNESDIKHFLKATRD